VLRAYGTGGWSYYASASGGTFTSPAGDNGTLTYANNVYTYTLADGETDTFNSSGDQTSWASTDGQSSAQPVGRVMGMQCNAIHWPRGLCTALAFCHELGRSVTNCSEPKHISAGSLNCRMLARSSLRLPN
jgi:hypothetical protein